MSSYAAILAVIILATLIAGSMLALAHLIGPKRAGRVKDATYESGVPVVGDARRRFNVRFYIVAMLFLLILLVGYVYAWRKGVFRWD